MRLFRGSKSAHQLSVRVRWESKDTPLGTNNQSQQPYHRVFDLKKNVPDSVKTYPGYRSNRLGTVCDVIARDDTPVVCMLYLGLQKDPFRFQGVCISICNMKANEVVLP